MKTRTLHRSARVCFAVTSLFIANGVRGGAPPATAPTTRPTTDSIQLMIDAKDYKSAVKAANQLLSLHGRAGEGIDRFQVTVLKGVAQSGLHYGGMAQQSFKAAQKETKDLIEIDTAIWTAELFKTAPDLSYTPKSAGDAPAQPAAFDLTNPAERTAALAALFDDRLSAIQGTVAAAAAATSWAPVIPALKDLAALDQLDRVVHGNNKKIGPLMKQVVENAGLMLGSKLKELPEAITAIQQNANAIKTETRNVLQGNYVVATQITHQNGLSDEDRRDLSAIKETCNSIVAASRELLATAGDQPGIASIPADATKVRNLANAVLTARYDKTSSVAVAGTISSVPVPARGTQPRASTSNQKQQKNSN